MDERAWHDRLDSTADSPGGLFEHFERRDHEGLTYHALPDERHGVPRGTVVVPETGDVVYGYPSTPRVFVVDPGVPEFFDGPVVVDEKLDGYNVRVADVDGPLAFTRSGYVCPWTTDRARDLLDPGAFLGVHPDRTICAELIGPETPYTSHDYDDVDSNAIRVFDVREGGESVGVDECDRLCERFGFDRPQRFGRGTPEEAVEVVRDAIARLDERGREGVIVRSVEGSDLLKYTTGSQHRNELAHAFSQSFEYGREFLFSRVLREAFQTVEFDDAEQRRERARALGESILLPMVESIEAVRDGEPVGERHTVRADPDTVEALLDHQRAFGLTVDVEDDRREGDDRIVEFLKVAESTADQVEYYLGGGTSEK